MSVIQIEELPESVEDFVDLHEQIAQFAEGGTAMMIAALLVYAQDKELGQECLALAVDRDRLQEGPHGYHGRQLAAADLALIERQIERQPYLPRAYVQGATPANGYALPAPPYEIAFVEHPDNGDSTTGRFQAFVTSSGASEPRPVRMRRNEFDTWKAVEWRPLLTSVQEPAPARR